MQSQSISKILAESNCNFRCKSLKYDVNIVSIEQIYWNTQWISEVFVQPAADYIEEVIEYKTYDLANLIGDIGGYLGLLLGWSFLSVVLGVPAMVKPIMYFVSYKKPKKAKN